MSLKVYPVIWDEELHEYRPMRWAEILESRRLLEQSQARKRDRNLEPPRQTAQGQAPVLARKG